VMTTRPARVWAEVTGGDSPCRTRRGASLPIPLDGPGACSCPTGHNTRGAPSRMLLLGVNSRPFGGQEETGRGWMSGL
jgi:hypothetical protein